MVAQLEHNGRGDNMVGRGTRDKVECASLLFLDCPVLCIFVPSTFPGFFGANSMTPGMPRTGKKKNVQFWSFDFELLCQPAEHSAMLPILLPS